MICPRPPKKIFDLSRESESTITELAFSAGGISRTVPLAELQRTFLCQSGSRGEKQRKTLRGADREMALTKNYKGQKGKVKRLLVLRRIVEIVDFGCPEHILL